MKKVAIFDFYGVLVRRGAPNEELVPILHELKNKGVLLYMMSNAGKELAQGQAEEFPLLGELFEKSYYSWQVGFPKDDSRAYEFVLKDNNLKPEECIYFDDSERNVAAARSLGIESHLFEDATQVRTLLLSQRTI